VPPSCYKAGYGPGQRTGFAVKPLDDQNTKNIWGFLPAEHPSVNPGYATESLPLIDKEKEDWIVVF